MPEAARALSTAASRAAASRAANLSRAASAAIAIAGSNAEPLDDAAADELAATLCFFPSPSLLSALRCDPRQRAQSACVRIDVVAHSTLATASLRASPDLARLRCCSSCGRLRVCSCEHVEQILHGEGECERKTMRDGGGLEVECGRAVASLQRARKEGTGNDVSNAAPRCLQSV